MVYMNEDTNFNWVER